MSAETRAMKRRREAEEAAAQSNRPSNAHPATLTVSGPAPKKRKTSRPSSISPSTLPSNSPSPVASDKRIDPSNDASNAPSHASQRPGASIRAQDRAQRSPAASEHPHVTPERARSLSTLPDYVSEPDVPVDELALFVYDPVPRRPERPVYARHFTSSPESIRSIASDRNARILGVEPPQVSREGTPIQTMPGDQTPNRLLGEAPVPRLFRLTPGRLQLELNDEDGPRAGQGREQQHQVVQVQENQLLLVQGHGYQLRIVQGHPHLFRVEQAGDNPPQVEQGYNDRAVRQRSLSVARIDVLRPAEAGELQDVPAPPRQLSPVGQQA